MLLVKIALEPSGPIFPHTALADARTLDRLMLVCQPLNAGSSTGLISRRISPRFPARSSSSGCTPTPLSSAAALRLPHPCCSCSRQDKAEARTAPLVAAPRSTTPAAATEEAESTSCSRFSPRRRIPRSSPGATSQSQPPPPLRRRRRSEPSRLSSAGRGSSRPQEGAALTAIGRRLLRALRRCCWTSALARERETLAAATHTCQACFGTCSQPSLSSCC